jgi:GNAT superfamily N-acetyltransferase
MRAPEEIAVSPVKDEAALGKFIKFPWVIYRNDPLWVPPIISEQEKFLDSRRGPFFEIGEAQYFLAYRQGELAGRISAHVNRLHDRYHGPETGFFGFFESFRDQAVADALLEAAAAWLRARGKSRLVGPMNFGIYDEMGLLVEGFDSMPGMFHTHNPPYYETLLTSWGFTKAMDWHAYRFTLGMDLAVMKRQLAKLMQGQSVEIRPYNRRELAKRSEEVFQLFNEAWEPNWGHVPLTRRQFQELMHNVRPLLRPGLVNFLVDGDQLVGFAIALPELNPLIKELNGRLNLWGKLRLLYWAKFKPLRQIRSMVIGIKQPYQGKRLHHALIMAAYIFAAQQPAPEKVEVDFSLIPSNLPHWIKVIKSFGGELYKVFRVFEKPV